MRHRTLFPFVAVALLMVPLAVVGHGGAPVPAPPVAGATYNVVDLGTLNGFPFSTGEYINASGQVAGRVYVSGLTGSHTFLYSDGAMTDLGTFGGTTSIPLAMNAAGQVTGWALLASGQEHAYIYDGAVMTDLEALGGTYSEGLGINNHGQVVGLATRVPGPTPPNPYYPFFYSAGVMTDLGSLPGGDGGQVGFINDAGQMAGVACTTTNPLVCLGQGVFHAILYSNGVLTDLGTLGGVSSRSRGLNNAGQVTGISTVSPLSSASHAFLYSDGVMTDLGTLGGTNSEVRPLATVINDAGQIAGFSQLPGNVAQHAFLYSGGLMTDVGTLGGTISQSTGINNNGQVTGYSRITPTSTATHAFLYSGGVLADLNNLIPANTGWTLQQANAINDHRQITGFGLIGGQIHAFLLTPVNMAVVQPPIDADGGTSFNAKKGVIPVKFALTVNGVPTCQLPPATIEVTRLAGGPVGVIPESWYSSPSTGGTNFRITGCQYHFNLEAKSLGAGRYRLDTRMDGEIVGSAQFTLK